MDKAERRQDEVAVIVTGVESLAAPPYPGSAASSSRDASQKSSWAPNFSSRPWSVEVGTRNVAPVVP
jgi:hypothetical protein